ncbi:phage/plasmid primase, P4 family [uncultured Lentilactobacillus sp.]|uniref:phage/plasmid primase, P4 family n=1 Tax=uncultured Lentilactobacillus sp. TaxID=2805375 RepID=UPI002597BB6F|nr:phage/plasmid primase, P4 family [uncultured Lentilactobacillus sp.]
MNYTKIPDELRGLKQWGCFIKRWQPERNKYTKIPMDANNGDGGKSNDPTTWVTFDEALQAMKKYKADGLAFFFQKPYIGIDIDHVRDEMEQYIAGDHDNIVADFIDHTNSYTESSISGTGVHIIVKGHIPGDRRRRSNVEIYPDGRFFALTGSVFGIPTDHISHISDKNIKYLYDKYLDNETDNKVAPMLQHNGVVMHLSESEVIDKIQQSGQAELFQRLMDGNWQERYTSQSEADQALCNVLAFWTAKDRTTMDAIFRKSKLYRPKWDEKRGKQTYGLLTINRAINDTVNVYEKLETPQYDFSNIIGGDGKKEKPDPMLKSRSYTDTGLRNRFLAAYPHEIGYNADRKKFMRFDGIKWKYINKGVISRMLDPVVAAIQKEKLLGNMDDDKETKAMEKAKNQFLKRSRNNVGKRAAMNEIADYVMKDDKTFDNITGSINTPSGMVNLSNGNIRNTTYRDLVTKVTNAEVQNQATPVFDSFMESIFPDHPELIPFVMRLIGYTALGTVAEQKSVFLLGRGTGQQNGSNGKSTLVQLFFNILGEYATNVEPKVITANRGGLADSSKDSQIADTKGARLISTSELEQGSILSESTLKRLTGNEVITAKRLYEGPVSFLPTGTLWMTSNYMPIIKGMDNGIWRRLITIPMTAKITNKDVHLMDKLMTEKAGIMRKIVDGAVEYSNVGLQVPQVCRDLTSELRGDMDTVGIFLNDCFATTGKSTDKVTWTQIADIYDQWQRQTGSSLTKWTLNHELGHRFDRYRTSYERGFVGLKVKPNHIPLKYRVHNKKQQ